MKIRMTITIGFNDKDTKFQLYPDRFYYDKIDELLKSNTIEAATLIKCEGYYKGDKENSMQVILLLDVVNESFEEISDKDTLNIHNFIKDVKNELNQECVMVDKQSVQCFFI